MNHIFNCDEILDLEYGGQLHGFQVAYSTYGQMNKAKSNVIWACHGLTGNSRVFEWWNGLFGEDDLFNPKEHFIVCANVLGSCYGTTNPLSINKLTGKKYYHDFPKVAVRDMVKLHIKLAAHLGIENIDVLIGGSGGGQQSVEWAIAQPERIKNMVLISSNAFHSAWGIAFSEAQRMAIQADKTSLERRDDAGQDGLKAARAIGVLSYRSFRTFEETQSEDNFNVFDNFKAATYLRHQGQKFVDRFDMFSYLTLINAYDAHNVGRSKKSIEDALSMVKSRTLVIGIISDLIFPICEQQLLAKFIKNAEYATLDSLYGHDGFLIETPTIAKIVKRFYRKAV
jgi:homoserine O-acetyltransferase